MAPPRHSGVLNKGLGFERLPVESAQFGRVRGIARLSPANPVLQKSFLKGPIFGERAGGPNAAQPVLKP
jgi:hypothetical protein